MGVIIAMSRLEDGNKIGNICRNKGLPIDAVYSTAAEVLRDVSDRDNGIVVCGGRLKDMSSIELKGYLPEFYDMIVIASGTVLEQCPDDVFKIATPFKSSDLVGTVDMLLEQQRRRIKKTIPSITLRTSNDKEIINRAKLLLMERNDMTEPEAYRYIQKCSMDSGNKMVESAEMILIMNN